MLLCYVSHYTEKKTLQEKEVSLILCPEFWSEKLNIFQFEFMTVHSHKSSTVRKICFLLSSVGVSEASKLFFFTVKNFANSFYRRTEIVQPFCVIILTIMSYMGRWLGSVRLDILV
jgi:hypothetical protein